MRAGLLRDILEFQECENIKSPSGAVSKGNWVKKLTARASKRRLTAIVDKDGVNASEKFIGNILVFQVRYNPKINTNQRVIYNGAKYSIQLLDRPVYDLNTYFITLRKIND